MEGERLSFDCCVPIALVSRNSGVLAGGTEFDTMWKLLMVMWEATWYSMEHLNVNKVTRLVASMKNTDDDDHNKKLQDFRAAFAQQEHKFKWLTEWEDYFTLAVKEAKKLNKAIRLMDIKDLRMILELMVSVCMSAEELIMIFNHKNNGQADEWAYAFPHAFRDKVRARQLPTRAKFYAETFYPDWWQEILNISAEEQEKWIRYAARAFEESKRLKAYGKRGKMKESLLSRDGNLKSTRLIEVSEEELSECLDKVSFSYHLFFFIFSHAIGSRPPP